MLYVLGPTIADGQEAPGTITGLAMDTDHDILPGAPIRLAPGNLTITANERGEFTFTNVAPGSYTITITYLGFSDSSNTVVVASGQVARVDAVLTVATLNQQVVVTAGRSYGDAEAINETRASDTVLNILPSTVIQSLPNANIADAVARLPGVTLERDEGEGKYVQIRGTEPRLSNLTVDGVIIPSPEGGVRQVKLDTIPADLIESVQINKTLQANMDGDAIGGSVNLVTKTAGERPNASFFGAGGFTPIINTVVVSEFGGTIGQRFLSEKRLGAIFGGSFDYNGRGIDDFEASQTILPGTTFTPGYNSGVLRSYKYDRRRYGFGGSLDYKIGETSLIYVRGLFSDFKDYGHRYEYILNTNDPTSLPGTNLPTITTERRDGDYRVANVVVGGNHVFATTWFNWWLAAGQARMLNPINGGESITDFVPSPNLTSSNCAYDPAATKTVYRPQFTPACFTEAYNPDNLQLNIVSQSNHGRAEQLNLSAEASGAKTYRLSSHTGTFELGFKIRNAHKFDDSYTMDYQHNANLPTPTAAPVLETAFIGGFTNPNYYNGSYKFGPAADWEKGNAYLAGHMSDFTLTSTYGGNGSNFDLIERVTAGYFMNTLDFGRFRLIAGLRIEGTDDSTLSFDNTTGLLDQKGGTSYVSLLPSASLRIRLDNSSDLRLVYSRALNRPDPQFLTASFSVDCGTQPCTVTEGNSTLRPEHANNYDFLYERYLTPLGLLQAGYFYKALTDPVVQILTLASSACPPLLGGSCFINTPVNGGSAYVQGFEFAFQQHFAYLPGLLSGLGMSANYAYTTSLARAVNPQLRSRHPDPPLLRQAPNTWNISPTYDRGRLSIRVGLAYNQANIYAYFYTDQTTDPTTGVVTPAPVPGGLKGPNGDQYLYSHFQVDAQGSYRFAKGLKFYVAGLNLNNEVFGFYYGSPQFVNQREYYKPTYTFGFRWDLGQE